MFGIADDILVVGFDDGGMVYDNALRRVLPLCQKVNLKLSREKCHFRLSSVPFFIEVILQAWSKT